MNKTKVKKNVIIGGIGQILVIALGIIVPRIMISNYGSDTNGVVGTVSQIFIYVALLEAGISQAARNALFGPMSENNYQETSRVLSIAQNYFRNISKVYAICVVVISFVLPFVLKTAVNKPTIALFVLIEGISGVLSFYYIEAISVILTADGRGYINNLVTVISRSFIYLTKIILAYMGISIVVLQIVGFVLTFFRVIFYRWYANKVYSWITWLDDEVKGERLQDRKSYVITEVAGTVISSTDLIVLSTCLSTELSSVYSVYKMVFLNASVLLNTIYWGVNYILGHTYHYDKSEYEKVHDLFNSCFIGIMTVFMAICYIMMIPFVRLYTRGITDVNYIYDNLPFFFCVVQILSWARYVSGNLTGLAGFAKKTSYISIIEAVINFVLSFVLVVKIGIIGILVANLISLPVKVLWCYYISDKIVLKRKYTKSIKILLANAIVFFMAIVAKKICVIDINSWKTFFVTGSVVAIVFLAIGIVMNWFANRDCVNVLAKIFKG